MMKTSIGLFLVVTISACGGGSESLGRDAGADSAVSDASIEAPFNVDPCGPFDFSAVKSRLEKAVADDEVRGAGIAILRKGCPTLMVQSYGNQTNDTVLELASASKAPAAAAIMTLVERGKLSLDTNIGEVLPDAPIDKKQITLRQLLSHSSGLAGNALCLGNESTSLALCVRQILAANLRSMPGTTFLYGGASYQVAGYMAEIASQTPWNVFFADALTNPCGFSSLSFAASPLNTLGSDSNPRIAGGAAANLNDYAEFLRLFTSSGSCGTGTTLRMALTADSVATLTANQIAALDQSDSVLPNAAGYGLGWWHERGQDGQEIVSDPGAFGSYPWMDTKNNYAAVLLIRKSLEVGRRLHL